MDPDDRLMEVNSVDFSSEEDRFGDGELTDTGNPIDGVANDSGTPVDSHSGIGVCPGAAESLRGYGRVSLAEVLNRMPRLSAPAACASQGAAEFLGVQSNPQRVGNFLRGLVRRFVRDNLKRFATLVSEQELRKQWTNTTKLNGLK